MKPRNKFERRVVALSATLPPISEAQKAWAEGNLFPMVGFRHGGRTWCIHCGKVFANGEDGKKVCPHCGKEIEVTGSSKRTYKSLWYYTIITTHKGMQVCRHYVVEKRMNRKGVAPTYAYNECVQNWIAPDGKHTIMALPTCMSMYYDLWKYGEDMSIKSDKYVRGHKYHICAPTYPRIRVIPTLRRNGYAGEDYDVAPSELFISLLTDSMTEMLAKTKQVSLLKHKINRGLRDKYLHSIRIAIRNGYIVKDASMWLDYIDLLDHFGLDTHNAHYVCPNDLREEHDRLMRRKRRQNERIRVKQRIAEAMEYEEQFAESKGKYFGLCFGNEGITISVLCSVKDILEEGTAMHHCVYECGYYKKKDSLILSARDSEGNRIETIEVSLSTYKVVQSRGVCNQLTNKHDQILNLMKQNMHRIASVA